MFERAKQLKLPASLVDLRHQATHEELPSMPALRQYVKQALDWIWNDFWRHQCPPNYTIRKITNAKDLRSEVEHYHKVAVTDIGPHAEPVRLHCLSSPPSISLESEDRTSYSTLVRVWDC